jgi:hypothetical protein
MNQRLTRLPEHHESRDGYADLLRESIDGHVGHDPPH